MINDQLAQGWPREEGVRKSVSAFRARCVSIACLLGVLAMPCALGDWPMLRGSPAHGGYVEESLEKPFRLAWAVEFKNERIGTAVEPIAAENKVFIGTHAGNVYALDSISGEALWRFEAPGAFLHSPAFASGIVVAASVDGAVHGIDSTSGEPRWRYSGPFGGFSAAPVIANETVFIGGRSGQMLALWLSDGSLRWKTELPAPIRQTAAIAGRRVFVTAEDLRLRCFDASTGGLLWESEAMMGQTARDYYPIVVETGGKTRVITRTNPLLNMSQRIGRDRTMLCRNAGVDDSGWQKVEAWTKSDQARGAPELWAREQSAIIDYLKTSPDAGTFYVFDADSGQRAAPAPVLWIGGCQGVGAQPAIARDHDLLVFYRSAYGNWNHGVAPLVALGLLSLEQNRITPLFHDHGKQPRWNCFWGTADESQNFVIAGGTALIVHQGTLSGFDLARSELFPIHGERDTFGGFRGPPWARNEWHGPARGGVAVAGKRIFWQTGSRVLCVRSGESGKPASIRTISREAVPARKAPSNPPPNVAEQRAKLNKAVREAIETRWAPLFVDPGLSGRFFSFDESGELFEALAFAFEHLEADLQARVKAFMRDELSRHPPFARQGEYSLREGRPREYFAVPPEYRARVGADSRPHPFGNLWRVWLYARRANEREMIRERFEAIEESHRQFRALNWTLAPAKGDLWANRYIASLEAFDQIAEWIGRPRLAHPDDTAKLEELWLRWWEYAAATGTMRQFNGSSELDPFIGQGDAISFKVAPHRHEIALFKDFSPGLARVLKSKRMESLSKVWDAFSALHQTWPLQGEERQVHFGENFLDPPGLALGAFKIAAVIGTPRETLAVMADLPFCRADLYHIEKLAIALGGFE